VILAAGQKGYRFVYPTAVISLLPLTLGSPQSEIDRDDAECELQKWEAAFAKLLAEYTGKTAEETLLACRSSRSFDARQAIAFGLFDRLVADSCGSLPGLVSPFQGFDR
jgi:ATP-dependent protease ClpP protease subunit